MRHRISPAFAGNMINSVLASLVEAPARRRTILLQAWTGSLAPISLRQEETIR
jgi:hypothetical protein